MRKVVGAAAVVVRKPDERTQKTTLNATAATTITTTATTTAAAAATTKQQQQQHLNVASSIINEKYRSKIHCRKANQQLSLITRIHCLWLLSKQTTFYADKPTVVNYNEFF